MKNLPLLIGTIVGSLVLVIGIAVFFSNSSSSTSAPGSQAQNFDEVEPSPEEDVLAEARNSMGPEDAAVTIVEFSDFQCPACRAVSPLIKQVTTQYPEDVRFVYRHLPLVSIHPYAQLAAQASEVAAEENLFFEYHDLLFERQPEWSRLSSASQVEDAFVEYAGELGIDTDSFRERINAEDVRERVTNDVIDTQSLRLTSTPTLFVNNRRVPAPGQLPQIVESLLEDSQE